MYHFHIPPIFTDMIPVFERRWYIDRFVEQKQREHEAVQRETQKAKGTVSQ